MSSAKRRVFDLGLNELKCADEAAETPFKLILLENSNKRIFDGTPFEMEPSFWSTQELGILHCPGNPFTTKRLPFRSFPQMI